MDDGEIAEFDVPYNLLQIPEGHLRRLVDQTGEIEAKHLEEQAREAMSTKLDDTIREACDDCSLKDQPTNGENKLLDDNDVVIIARQECAETPLLKSDAKV